MMVILQVLHDGLTSIPLKETVWAQPTIAELGVDRVDRVIVIPVNTLRDMYSTALMDVQENLQSFGEMWYQIFLWCLATSVFIHCISACVAFLALRKHSRGVFFPLLVVFIGFLYPVTGGVITSATIASVYETASFTMPGYASFLWGAGQAFIGFLVSYTRVLATL